MHLWPNLSILKGSKLYNVKNTLANRPKGISDETWAEFVKEEKLSKLLILNKVPKPSKKIINK